MAAAVAIVGRIRKKKKPGKSRQFSRAGVFAAPWALAESAGAIANVQASEFAHYWPKRQFRLARTEKKRGGVDLNCLPFLGQESKVREMGGFFMPPKHDRKMRELAVELFDEGYGRDIVAARLCMSASIVEKWLLTYRSVGSEVLLCMGSRKTRYALGDEGRRSSGRRGRGDGQARGHGRLRHRVEDPARLLVPALPRRRGRRSQAQARGQAEGICGSKRAQDARARARGACAGSKPRTPT